MPKRGFALVPGGPKRLELAWSFGWKNMEVRLDGTLVGTIPGADSLRVGQTFDLSVDGAQRVLDVQLVRKFGAVELDLRLDEEPLAGSASDPAAQVTAAAGIVYFLGALNVASGLIAVVFDVAFLRRLGLGIESAIAGVVFLSLGYLVAKKRSAIALGIAICLCVVDGLLSLPAVAEAGANPIGGLIFRGFLILGMARGFAAIRVSKQR
ncbi:MAG: hypothetical protein IT384_30505 [Deltaproteobacteria bacterium]|nr:hypothetical protein [Deltaproteobacteria bacterium]